MLNNIYGLLLSLGVTANYTGFFHCAYAVSLVLRDWERLLYITKCLYPEVAEHFNTSPGAVERNIRTAASAAWSSNRSLLEEMAKHHLQTRPTASQFIAILASYLIMNNARPST
jgi:two-component system response regulator (stage 0 sporulation protein A)